MTYRDLMAYILCSNIDLDEEIFKDGKILGFMTVDEYADYNNMGVATVNTKIDLGMLTAIKIGDAYFIPMVKMNEK